MMTYDPKMRISAEQALNDPWIVKNSPSATLTKGEMLRSMDHLKQFHTSSTLHKLVLTFMGREAISKRKEKKLRKAFQAFDKNNDGRLSKQEMVEAFKLYNNGNEEEAIKQVDAIMRRVDLNKNGWIDYNGT